MVNKRHILTKQDENILDELEDFLMQYLGMLHDSGLRSVNIEIETMERLKKILKLLGEK